MDGLGIELPFVFHQPSVSHPGHMMLRVSGRAILDNWRASPVVSVCSMYSKHFRTSGRQKFTLVSLLTKHSEVSGGSN